MIVWEMDELFASLFLVGVGISVPVLCKVIGDLEQCGLNKPRPASDLIDGVGPSRIIRWGCRLCTNAGGHLRFNVCRNTPND
jgi:hypothetical protein